MLRAGRCRLLTLLVAGAGLLCSLRDFAAGQEIAPAPRPLTESAAPAQPPSVASFPTAGARPYPINLATALKLGNVGNLDIALAARQAQAAAARLQGANVLWLPNLIFGTDYYRHDGQLQDIQGNVFGTSKQGFTVGGAPYAVFNFADAIFTPLSARQIVRVRQAELQTAANDTLLAVAQAYFNVQQARGQLAGAREAYLYTQDLMRRLDTLAPALTPRLEVHRSRALAAAVRQAELQSENNWRSASAELLRVLNLDPTLIVEPLEPSHLRITLLCLDKVVDDLIPVALTNRPELAAQQAQVQATLRLLQQEKIRPLVPSVLLRGFSTPVTGTLAAGYFGGGINGNMGNFSARMDLDLQVLWTLQNFGLGNRALIRQRTAENRAALTDLFRIQDRVAAEVVQAYSLAQTAEGRCREAETELREAQELVRQDLAALRQTKRLGEGGPIQLLARPQEVVAAIQMLQQGYRDYYASIADYNRAQFQLYRALGNPAQALELQEGGGANGAPCGVSPTPSPTVPSEPPAAAAPVAFPVTNRFPPGP